MSDCKFQWTDELVKEFAVYYKNKQGMPGELWGKDLMNEFIKSKERIPLYTTEDGVDIHYGDTVFVVNTHFNIGTTIFERECGENDLSYYQFLYRYFSNQAAAKEYVLYNKPLFSLNNIIKAKDDNHLKGDSLIDELINIAKSKINNQ